MLKKKLNYNKDTFDLKISSDPHVPSPAPETAAQIGEALYTLTSYK